MIKVVGRSKYTIWNDKLYIEDLTTRYEVPEEYRPYFFIKEKDLRMLEDYDDIRIEDGGLKTLQGEPVFKVSVRFPPTVEIIRRDLERRGIEIYEADIPYIQRMLIDKVIEVNYTMDNVCYIDIELDDSKGFPNKAGEFKILSIACEGTNPKWFYHGDYETERDMLIDFYNYICENKKTVFVGWNINFDYQHLLARFDRLDLKSYWGRCVDTIDLYDLYSDEVKDTKLSRYTLEEVAIFEEIPHKIERDKPFHQMSREELEEYNRRDAQILAEIEEKYGFVEQKLELANEVNWFIDILTPLRFGEALILRRLRELGYVAPTRYEIPEKSYKGGYVKEPKAGVFEKIVVFDINSLYPNIIVHNKIDVANLKGECLPHIVEYYLEKRQELKRLLKETGDKKYDVKQKAVKVVSNSLYGLFGQKYFRFYDVEKAGTVTRIGRETIQGLERFMKDLGYTVLYADTDSVFIQVEDLSIVPELESLINVYLAPYTAKVDYIFEKVLFFGTEKRAAKKRYYGITTEGKEIIRGIELRRRDWCGLTKKVLHDALRSVFSGITKEQFILKKADYKRRLYRGEFDQDLIITKSVKDLNDYKVNQPHVKALRKALAQGYPNTGKISYIIVRGGDVEPVIESLKHKPDYRWYWKHQILPVLERVEKAVWVKKGKQQHLNMYYK